MILSVLIASTILSFALPASVAFATESKEFYENLFTADTVAGNVGEPTRTEIQSVSPITDSITANGVSQFNVNSWLILNPKARGGRISGTETGADYYQYYIANTKGLVAGVDPRQINSPFPETFLIKISYKDIAGNEVSKVKPFSHQYMIQDKEFVKLTKPFLIPYFGMFNNDNVDGTFVSSISTSWKVSTITHNNFRTQVIFDTPVPFNTPVIASLWYCADIAKDTEGYRPSNDPEKIATFNDLCGGRSYFKITEKSYTTPPTPEAATTQAVAQADAKGPTSGGPEDNLPVCSIFNGLSVGGISVDGGGSWMGCVANLVYYGLFIPASAFAWLMGQLFDFFIGFSLGDTSYRFDFIKSGWRLVRDISNIFFIVILIYTALSAVFGIGKVSYKKVIPQLIINALLINFSLFGVQILIDMSNIVGRLFYNNVQVQDASSGTAKIGASGYAPISESIISAFNPQKIFDASLLNKDTSTDIETSGVTVTKGQNDSFITTTENKIKSSDPNSNEYASYYSLISLTAAILIFMVGVMFWNVTFMFLGRIVGLWLSMLVAPFAIMSRNMPNLTGFPTAGWDKWWDNLKKYLLIAPIFLLYLYLIHAILQPIFKNFIKIEGAGFFATLLTIVIPMLIIYFLIKKGEGIAKEYAGELSTMINTLGKKATGFVAGAALGVATGGVSMAGRGLIATGARSLQQKDSWVNRNLDKKTFIGKLARKTNATLDGAQKSSYDMRQSSFLKNQFKNLEKLGVGGVNWNTDNSLVNRLNLGTKHTKGGLEAYEKRKEDEAKKDIEGVKTSFKNDDDAEKFYKNTILAREHAKLLKKLNTQKEDEDYQEVEAKKVLDKMVKDKKIESYDKAALDAETIKQKEKIEKNITDNKAFTDFEKNQEKEYGKVKDNKSLTQAMRLRYADNIKNDNTSESSTLRAIAGAGIPVLTGDFFLEEKTRGKAADKYGKDVRKSFKNSEKQEKELEGINKTLNEILGKMAEEIPDIYNTEEFKNDKGKLDHKEMDGDKRHDMIKQYKTHLQDELESREAKLEQIKQRVRTFDTAELNKAEKEFTQAMAQGDEWVKSQTKIKLETLKKEQASLLEIQQKAIKDKNEIKEKIDEAKAIESRYTSKTKDKEEKERKEKESKGKNPSEPKEGDKPKT